MPMTRTSSLSALLRLASLLLLAGSLGWAQPERSSASHPLLDLLAAVPAPTAVEELAYYNYLDYFDLRAMEASQGLVAPASWSEFDDLPDGERAIWLATFRRTTVWSTTFLSVFPTAAGMREAVGFDFFDVDRLMGFGQPPETSQLLAGRFDPAAIAATYESNGYARTPAPDLTALLLRRADGEDDLALDLLARNPANPFGGRFGRREPVAVLSEHLVANSPSWERLLALAETFEGGRPSLLDTAVYRAAAEALVHSEAAPEYLTQALFVLPLDFVFASPEGIAQNALAIASLEEIEQLAQYVAEQLHGPLPPYALALLADGHDGDEQVAQIALVYPSEEPARQAKAVLEARLATFSGQLPPEGGPSLMEAASGRLADSVTYASGDRTVLVVSVRYPAAAADRAAAGEGPSAGQLYRQWLGAMIRRSFLPLAITP